MLIQMWASQCLQIHTGNKSKFIVRRRTPELAGQPPLMAQLEVFVRMSNQILIKIVHLQIGKEIDEILSIETN